jgi:formylglycine-generating enzyme required for sulfatase activity
MHTLRFATTWLFFAFTCTIPADATAQQAGALEHVAIMMPAGPVQIDFRFCPPGTIYPGMPDAAASAAPVVVRGFYLGETEITVGQMRGVMGSDGIGPLIQRAAVEEKNKPEYRRALESGAEEPALFVGLDDAVRFCHTVQQAFDQARLAGSQMSVESRQFRLPGYVEWQYAARAVTAAEANPERVHFNRWPNLSELTQANQQKCQEVWMSLGKQGPFQGSQSDFLVLSSATSPGDSQKVREILEEAFSLAFKAEKRTAAGVGVLRAVRSTLPNEWNIFDMHDSVTEWTIWASSADPRAIWDQLKTRSDMTGYENSFLSGGSFKDSYFGPGSLTRFTFWGGGKLTDGKPGPFPYSAEIADDQAPGFRIVMERLLAKDWLYMVRRSAKQEGDLVSRKSYMDDSENLIRELTPTNSTELKVIGFYKLLSDSSTSRSQLAGHLTSIAGITDSAAGESAGSAAAGKLNALLKKNSGDGAPAKAATSAESDDQTYFRYVASRIRGN